MTTTSNQNYSNKGKYENDSIESVRKNWIKSGMILLKTNKDITNFLKKQYKQYRKHLHILYNK